VEEVNRDIVSNLRVNERIRAKEVRLVGDTGGQLGVMPLAQALEMAKKSDLDLVEVAPTAVPPVCRLLDYGKYKYEQTKKERGLRKSQKVSLLREVRMRPKIGNHDFEAKARLSKKLLEERSKVRVTILFRGREITHPDIGQGLLQRMAESLKEIATIDRQPLIQGRRMTMILAPIEAQKAKIKEEVKES